MLFKDYIHHHRLTYKEFGERINYNGRYLNSIANGHLKPGKKVIKLIVQATNGQVTENEIVDDRSAKKESMEN